MSDWSPVLVADADVCTYLTLVEWRHQPLLFGCDLQANKVLNGSMMLQRVQRGDRVEVLEETTGPGSTYVMVRRVGEVESGLWPMAWIMRD